MVAWSPKQLKYILLLVLDSPNHRHGQQHHGNHAKWPQYQPNPDQAKITKQNVVSTWHRYEKKNWVCKLKNKKVELAYNLHPRHLDPINSCPSSLWEELCEGLLSDRKESESRKKLHYKKGKVMQQGSFSWLPEWFTYPEGLLASLIGFGGVVTFDSQLVSLASDVCTQSRDVIRKL